MTYSEFLGLFPDNATCLDYLRDRYFPTGTPCPKCGKPSKFHRIKGRSAYSCQHCGHHVYPTANTIFHKSTTSLQLWFYAIFLMASTRCGISAKQLEREIGVSNKTALRMFRQIRTLLHEGDDEDEMLGGAAPVEVDETYIGAKRKRGTPRGRPGPDHPHKTPVFGAVERGGRVIVRVVPDVKALTLRTNIKQFVLPKSMVYTDDFIQYRKLGKHGYTHHRVNHSQNVYVAGDVHTNSIEGFFGLMKTGIRGVYHSVSRKHLQSYADEYAFRYNRRNDSKPMFWAILDRVQKNRLQPA
jgi:transposase-like protein